MNTWQLDQLYVLWGRGQGLNVNILPTLSQAKSLFYCIFRAHLGNFCFDTSCHWHHFRYYWDLQLFCTVLCKSLWELLIFWKQSKLFLCCKTCASKKRQNLRRPQTLNYLLCWFSYLHQPGSCSCLFSCLGRPLLVPMSMWGTATSVLRFLPIFLHPEAKQEVAGRGEDKGDLPVPKRTAYLFVRESASFQCSWVLFVANLIVRVPNLDTAAGRKWG